MPNALNFRTANRLVAVSPFGAQKTTTAKMVSGLSIIDEKVSLTPLTVVFDHSDFGTGETVYVDAANAANFAWSKIVYEIEGNSFILVPEEHVVVVKRLPTEREQSGAW